MTLLTILSNIFRPQRQAEKGYNQCWVFAMAETIFARTVGKLAKPQKNNNNKKLSYRRGTVRCVVSVEILPIAMQQCRNYFYDKS